MARPRVTSAGASAPYLVLCAVATLLSARLFYGYLLQQTGGEWSAPLDDVFIHFDYARAAARGYPFQWSEGNGYSSGNTSLSYPFVLAVGYWLGFRANELMVWAGVVASVSVLGFLWGAGRAFRDLPWPTVVLAPLAVFSVGALSWSLWSGMEVALFLGVWGLAFVAACELAEGDASPRRGGWVLGALGLALVVTRPEGATSILVLGLFASMGTTRHAGLGAGLGVLWRAGLPAVGALVLQAIVNRVMTGEVTANGAIVKLALENPYMPPAEKLADWRFNLTYAFDRMQLHHFGELPWWGKVPFVLALVPLFDRRTRRFAVVLLSSGVLWTLLVALNGQVRWQNERYLMPGVAWLLVAAGLGVAVLVTPARRAWLRVPRAVVGGVVALVLVLGFWRGERVQYRDQIWFFGRASRNILEQHVKAGRLLRTLDPPAHRVLVGDAGALMYASDLPGFDLIGLGGYHDLPLARAGVHGIAATLELIERVPPAERPDVMAIYPTWWPSLPGWFGQRITSVPVRGNVICGGAEKVILRADWHLLGTGEAPRSLRPGERVVDEVDVADLVSERAHGYAFPRPLGGWTEMRVLPDPREPSRDMWDAGRRIPNDRPETMTITGRPLRVVLRTVADQESELDVTIAGRTTRVRVPKTGGWSELSLDVPQDAPDRLPLVVTPRRGEWVSYHVWAVR